MIKILLMMIFGIVLFPMHAVSGKTFPTDPIQTDSGPIEITMVGHGTLMIKYNNKVIHIDPWSRLADYSQMPKADLILVTHGHGDHFDINAITTLRNPDTQIVSPKVCSDGIEGVIVMNNGDIKKLEGFSIEAIPAYNIVHMRSENTPYHPKGEGNGYILTCGGKRLYIAGDTENIPEMKALKNIEAAFLPMNLPYTMSPEMVADAAKAFKPKTLYPYHYGTENMATLAKHLKEDLEKLMADEPAVEIRFPILKE